MATRALYPGLSRCWHRWAYVSMCLAPIEEELARLQHRGRASSMRRAVSQRYAQWRAHATAMGRLRACLEVSGWLPLAQGFQRWARHHRAAVDAMMATAPIAKPRKAAERHPSPPVRAVATGWHSDLSLYGTTLSHRDEAIQHEHVLRKSEKHRVGALETKLAFAEARAAVLERRLALRDKASQEEQVSDERPQTAPGVIRQPTRPKSAAHGARDLRRARQVAAASSAARADGDGEESGMSSTDRPQGAAQQLTHDRSLRARPLQRQGHRAAPPLVSVELDQMRKLLMLVSPSVARKLPKSAAAVGASTGPSSR